jgi:hypothetical protein
MSGKRRLLPSLTKRKEHANAVDEEYRSAEPFLIDQTPRGKLQSKHLLETIALFNKIIDSRQDLAAYCKQLDAIYKIQDHRYDDAATEGCGSYGSHGRKANVPLASVKAPQAALGRESAA